MYKYILEWHSGNQCLVRRGSYQYVQQSPPRCWRRHHFHLKSLDDKCMRIFRWCWQMMHFRRIIGTISVFVVVSNDPSMLLQVELSHTASSQVNVHSSKSKPVAPPSVVSHPAWHKQLCDPTSLKESALTSYFLSLASHFSMLRHIRPSWAKKPAGRLQVKPSLWLTHSG